MHNTIWLQQSAMSKVFRPKSSVLNCVYERKQALQDRHSVIIPWNSVESRLPPKKGEK